MSKPKERPVESTSSRDSEALRRALAEGEARRLEYVATLHPREREALDPH
jgi:hypothetical protein